MRKDMYKIIVERPRGGAGFTMNRSRHSDPDDLPHQVGMRKFRDLNGTRSKYLNENLAPLRRYLFKQVGRPWDRVYSEIRENLEADNVVQRHVLDHLDDYVVRNVAIGKKGEWLNGNPECWSPDLPWHQPLYVDPRDGLLKKSAKLWKKLGVKPPRTRWAYGQERVDHERKKISEHTELLRLSGIWYEIHYGRIENARADEFAYDKVSHKRVPAASRHVVRKRQLSRSELVCEGLENIELV